MYARYDDDALLVHRRGTVRAASATMQCTRVDTNAVQPACARCHSRASLLLDLELRVDPAAAAARPCAARRPAHRAMWNTVMRPRRLPLYLPARMCVYVRALLCVYAMSVQSCLSLTVMCLFMSVTCLFSLSLGSLLAQVAIS